MGEQGFVTDTPKTLSEPHVDGVVTSISVAVAIFLGHLAKKSVSESRSGSAAGSLLGRS